MFKNIRLILDVKSQYLVCLIFIGLIVSGILEMVGIGLLPALVLAIDNTNNFISKINYLPLKFFLDDLSKEKLLIILCATVFVIFLVKNIFLFFLIIFENLIMRNIRVKLSNKLMHKYLSNPYFFFIDKNTSTFLRNLQSEIGSSTNYISAVLILSRELLVVIFLLGLLLYNSTKITLIVFFIFGAVTLILYFTFKNKTSKVSHKSLLLREKIFKIINEFLTCIKDVKIFKAEKYVLKNYTSTQLDLANADFYIKNLNSFPRLLLEVVSIGLILVFCVFFIATSSFNELLPNLTLLIILLVRFLPAFSLINQSLNRIRVLKVSIDLIAKELSLNFGPRQKITKLSDENELLSLDREISFKNVSFKYPESKKLILDNISLNIKKGDFIGIIGESGSGKTTLINLLCGLLDPNEGSILFDDKDIKKNSVNKIIGYVPQDIFLLDETIKNNIAFGIDEKDIDDKNIIEATKVSNLSNFLDNNNLGIESSVGNLGIKLSGGQRQRIGIARAIYKNSPLLVLDESTSSLDINAESKFINEIKNLKSKLTIIFVSHRISALKYCDNIYKLVEGKIVKS